MDFIAKGIVSVRANVSSRRVLMKFLTRSADPKEATMPMGGFCWM